MRAEVTPTSQDRSERTKWSKTTVCGAMCGTLRKMYILFSTMVVRSSALRADLVDRRFHSDKS